MGRNPSKTSIRFSVSSLIGSSIGLVFVHVISSLFAGDPFERFVEDAEYNILMVILSGILFGICIGASQWYFMKDLIPRFSKWILVSTMGWSIGITLGIVLFVKVWIYFDDLRGYGDFGGFPSMPMYYLGQATALFTCLTIVGISQWFVIRQSIKRSFFWIVINPIIWTIIWLASSTVAIILIAISYGLLNVFFSMGIIAIPTLICSMISGLILGKFLSYSLKHNLKNNSGVPNFNAG